MRTGLEFESLGSVQYIFSVVLWLIRRTSVWKRLNGAYADLVCGVIIATDLGNSIQLSGHITVSGK
jgi:hypothetical protein